MDVDKLIANEGWTGAPPESATTATPSPSDESLKARIAQRERVQQFMAKIAAKQEAKSASAQGSLSQDGSAVRGQAAPEETDEQILAYAATFFASILWPVVGFIARRMDPRTTLDSIEAGESDELAAAFLPWFRRYSALRLVARTLGAPALLIAKIRAKLRVKKEVIITAPASPPPAELSKTARNVTALRFDPAEHVS